jgi:flavin-dependent dehydrogenase
VVLFDKARFPRDKCCGDGLTTGALRHLDHLGLHPEAVASWQTVSNIRVRSVSGRTVLLPLPVTGTFAAVARRMDLDAALLDVARAAGVKVYDGHAVLGAGSMNDELVTVEVQGLGLVRSRYAIAADGMWSPMRKSLAVPDEPGYLGEWHAFRQYFVDVAPAASTQMWVWFEPELLPGYAWSFPLPGGRANVGFGIHRRAGHPTREMRQQWNELLARPHIREVLGPAARPEVPHKAWPIPARVGMTELTAAKGRVLFVGDAARATDSMTGEGIGQAFDTAALAAQAIVAAGPSDPEMVGARYRRLVHAGLAADDRVSRLLSRAVTHRKGVQAALALAGASEWTRRNFARWLFEDYPRALLATPYRWHPGMLHGPGAFLVS